MSTSPLSISSTRNDVVVGAQRRSAEARAKIDAAQTARGDFFGEHLRKKAASPSADRRLEAPRGDAGDPRSAGGSDQRRAVTARKAQDADRSRSGESSRAGSAATNDHGPDGARDEGTIESGSDELATTAGEAGQSGGGARGVGGELESQIAEAAAQPLSVRNLNQLLATIDPALVAKGVVKSPASGQSGSADADVATEGEANPEPTSELREPTVDGAGSEEREGDLQQASIDDAATGAAAPRADLSAGQGASRGAPDSVTITDASNTVEPRIPSSPADLTPAGRGGEPTAPAITIGAPVPGSALTSGADTKTGLQANAAPLFTAQHVDLTGADAASVAGQVSRGLAAALKQQGGQVTLRLRPEALGHVRIELSLQPGLVDVRFVAGSAQAQALLKGSLDTLKESLERQGLTVGRVQVDGDDADVLSSISQARKDAGGGGEGSSGQSSASDSSSAPNARTVQRDQDVSPERETFAGDGGHGERHSHGAHDGAERADVQSGATRSGAIVDELALGAVPATRNGVLDELTLRLDAVA